MERTPNTRWSEATTLSRERQHRSSHWGRAAKQVFAASPYWLPALAIFVTFTYYPLVRVAYLSFTDADLLTKPAWVGLENYRYLFEDPNFWNSLRITAIFSVATTVLGVTLGMALGFLMCAETRLTGLVRGAIFAPVVVSIAATAILWLYFLNPNVGPINLLLAGVGIPGPKWLQTPSLALPTVILVNFWKGVGFAAVLYMAGLKQLPQELEDAAAVDGAGRAAVARFITIPLLAPTTLLIAFISLVNSFQAYGLVLLMTRGGPAGSTNLVGYFLYENAFRFFQMGYASAISIVLFVVLMVLTLVQFKLSERKIHYR